MEREDFRLIQDEPQFYGSFIRLIDEEPLLEEDIASDLRDAQFRRDMERSSITPSLVREIAPYLIGGLRKPQRLLIDQEDYYVAIDEYTQIYYICFRDLLMIDIDTYKENRVVGSIEDSLPHCRCQVEACLLNSSASLDRKRGAEIEWKKHQCEKGGDRVGECAYRYRVFRSRGGFHAFLVSKAMDSKSDESLQLMIEAGSDLFYTTFSHLRGWSVRLSRKEDEKERGSPLYSLLGDVVKGRFVCESEKPRAETHLCRLLQLHLNLSEVFSPSDP